MFWYVIVSDLFLLGFYCFKWCCVSSSYIKSAEYQEKDHDDCRSMYLPRGSSTGIAIVLRCDQLTSESYSVHIQ